MTKSFFKDINCWDDFVNKLTGLNNKEKGAAFELLTKLYFKTNPLYLDYDDVWLLKEVPQKELDNLKISRQDLGIDLIAKKGKEYHAIQCKYHGDKNKNVTFKEVATFLQMVESNKKIEMGYICSSANGTSRNYQKIQKKNIQEILSDSWQMLNKENFNNFRKVLNKKAVTYKPFKPRKHQKKAIKEAKNHFIKENSSRGKLIFPCGAGKSLTGFWLAEALESKATLIAVPSLSLVKQTLEVYLREIVANKIKVEWLCICSDEGIGTSDDVAVMTNNIGVACKTDPKYIRDWLKANKNEHKIIFTTYQSGHLIADISKKLKMSFDVGIFDEAHKTVGSSLKQFSYLLFEKNIKIDKRIFMTATERFYSGSKEDIISMDEEDVYGATFTQMSFKEAIDLNLLTDYKVITIDIKKSEIAEFIKDNNLVQLNDKWKKETEARSLASMLAMRKAMKKFKIKNVVSFHSSIEKARRNKELQEYITNTYNYKPIDTFTVSGKIPTSKRNDIVQEFAKSNRALITNARCLTEGIDVPNIDCIVFADPRKSRVDIVQALGRALRKKEGKEWGYVILPVVYDEDTNEIDNDNFNEIINIVRGLAANDERIVEYFKDKSIKGNSKRDMVGGSEVFSLDSSMLKEKDLASQLQIKIWEKLSKFQWMPFKEAKEYVKTLNLNSAKEWGAYVKSGKLIHNIPRSPKYAYIRNGWISWGDWLGTGIISHSKKEFLSFYDARKYVRSLKFKNTQEWKSYLKSKARKKNIPTNPHKVYKKSFLSFSDWIGTIPGFDGTYMDFEDARKCVRNLKLKSSSEWRAYCKSGKLPYNIPSGPGRYYKDKGWISFGDWLGTGRVADNLKKFRDFKSARKFARKLNLKNTVDWKNFCKSGELPIDIPKSPRFKYKHTGWISMGDWLGTGTIADQNKRELYLDYNSAKKIIHKFNIKNSNDWRKFVSLGKKPKNIPSSPQSFYKNSGWVSWGEWLGNSYVYQAKRKYLSFNEARKYVWKLKLKTFKEWTEYAKSDKKPKNIPSNPRIYNEFLSGKDWIGTVPGFDGKYLDFEEARKYVRNLKLKSSSEWRAYCKSGKLPVGFTKSPHKIYKNKGWISFGDWLGTGRVADGKQEWASFEEVKQFVKKNNIKTKMGWYDFKKRHKLPINIPSNPYGVYKRKKLWVSWADFLGK